MKMPKQSDRIKQIFIEFEKYDKLHHEFLLDTEISLFNLLSHHPSSDISKEIKAFAISLINAAYEIIEKDNTYPDYRLKTELDNQAHILQQLPAVNDKLFSKVAWAAREKMLDYFPDLFNLSADGFHLLERISNYKTKRFLLAIDG